MVGRTEGSLYGWIFGWGRWCPYVLVIFMHGAMKEEEVDVEEKQEERMTSYLQHLSAPHFLFLSPHFNPLLSYLSQAMLHLLLRHQLRKS